MNNSRLHSLVEGAIMVALAAVLSYIRIFKLPWGGSITLVSMLPIMLYSIRHGIKKGLGAAFAFSLIQLFQGISDGLFAWGLTPLMLVACILIYYIFAFSVLGFAGLFSKNGLSGYIGGTALAGLLRFLCHFLSGVIIWHSFGELWEGFSTENEWLYSLLYNGAYMLPEIIFTQIAAAALFKLPQTKKLFGLK